MMNPLEKTRLDMVRIAQSDLRNYEHEIALTKERLNHLVLERDAVEARLRVLETSAVVVVTLAAAA